MKKVLSIILVSTLSFPVFSQNVTDANEPQPDKAWYGQELFLQNMMFNSSNPVSISYNPYSSLNSVDGSYSRQEGSFKPVDGAGNSNLVDFNIYGTKKVNKISFEGSLQYSIHDLNNSRWGNTVLTSTKNPFIIADSLIYDSIPNDQNREIFNLNGGFSWQTTDRLSLGLRANYKVSSKADQADPRFEAHGARVSVNPGMEYKLSDKFRLGLSLSAEVYHENVQMDVEDNLLDPAHTIVFLFQEIGNYSVENVTGYLRRYNGKVFGGALQNVFTSGKIANFMELGGSYNLEEAIDGGSSYIKRGGDYKQLDFQISDRFQIKGKNTLHNISLNAGMLMGTSKNFKQSSNYDKFHNIEWTILSSEVTQKEKDINANLSYRFDLLKNGRSHLTAELNGGMDMVSVNQYPDEYYSKYSLANAGLSVSKRIWIHKFCLNISADGSYHMPLKELDYELPVNPAGKKRFMNGYFIPKYQYFAAEYLCAGASVGISYPVAKGQSLNLTAGYRQSDYKGEYSRFDNRKSTYAKLTYTF